jgi:hypothetical protein
VLLSFFLFSEQRAHIVYSSYEYRYGLPPMIVSPLSNMFCEKFSPLMGYCSRPDDCFLYTPLTLKVMNDRYRHASAKTLPSGEKVQICNNLDNTRYASTKFASLTSRLGPLRRLQAQLTELMKVPRLGYDGEVNADGERHGHGVCVYENGEKYIGKSFGVWLMLQWRFLKSLLSHFFLLFLFFVFFYFI